MPDVNKILKDLELKAVGLDPATNAMQTGYFIAFRNVGLPIHRDDFANPWSPLGTNLAKDIPPTPPADPATAPKTGSANLDTSKEFAANIGASMQSYLNGFLLTDSQLAMSNTYAVMPGAAQISDAWYALITGANGIPPQSTISDDLKASYDKAKATLMDADGNVTPHYQAYMQYEQEYKDKVRAWHKAYAAAFTDPMKLQAWPVEGTSYQDDADEAMNRWNTLGFKQDIETAIDFLSSRGEDPAIALISRAKKRFINSLNEFQGVGEIPYTIMLPNSWWDPDNDDGWDTYSSSESHQTSNYTESDTSYGGSAGISVGFWSASGGFEHSDSHESLDMTSSDIEISFSYSVVDIKRPWMDSTLLSLKNWFLMGDYKRGCISDGTMGQQQGKPDPTFFPSVVTSLVLVKDVHISWSSFSSEWSKAESVTSGGGSVGWGPFAVSGHYSHHGKSESLQVDTSGEGLVIPGIQLLGYVSMINPLSPALDSAPYMQQQKPA